MGRFMIEEPSKTARELFVEELRRTYDNGWDVKNTPESKANNIMTIYDTVAALLFGFGALFLRNLYPDYAFLSGFVGLLIAGIIASVAAIVLCSLSFRLQKYTVAIGPGFFVDKGNLVGNFKNSSRDTFNDTMIAAYLQAMEKNDKQNQSKVKYLKIAHWLFVASMIVIPILLAIVVHAVEAKGITFPIVA